MFHAYAIGLIKEQDLSIETSAVIKGFKVFLGTSSSNKNDLRVVEAILVKQWGSIGLCRNICLKYQR